MSWTANDLFSGPGGFSEAVHLAGGRTVWAGNHDAAAVAIHSANHPDCEHAREDLRIVDWSLLPDCDVLVASPECKQHSNASQPSRSRDSKSGKAKRKRSRALAYEVIHAADALEPAAIVVENVPRFRKWRLFNHWLDGLRELGYHVAITDQCASFHGVPQRRHRVFIVATRKPMSPFALDFLATAEPGVESIIDWDEGDWRPLSDAEPGARERMLAGRRFGRRYWAQHVTGHRGKPLTSPFSTITCQDHHVVVDGDQYRPITVRETARAFGFPETYQFPVAPSVAKSKLGDAVCPPLAAAILARVAGEMGL